MIGIRWEHAARFIGTVTGVTSDLGKRTVKKTIQLCAKAISFAGFQHRKRFRN
jgi:hypothetical protein